MLKRSFSLFLPLRSVQRAGQKHGVCGSARWTLRLPQPTKASLQHSWLITGITKEPQLEAHYRRADRIYMDCETSAFPSGVHPHISDLINRMDLAIQKKCLLYHYDQEPKAPEDMFCGILKTGDSHPYPE